MDHQVFFDEGGDNSYPPVEAVSNAKSKVEHSMMNTPYIKVFEVGAGWIETAWAEECMVVP